jgi:hypothetical protein
MNDRLMIAAMAMQGMLASPDCIGDAQAVSGDAIECADALLAAAGEKDDPATHEDCVSVAVHNAVMDRLQVDFDALKARAEAAESKLAACERERDALKAEVAMRERQVVDFSARVADDERVFKTCKIEAAIPSLLDDAVTWIAANLEPEDVFSDIDLCAWAQEAGFVKKVPDAL